MQPGLIAAYCFLSATIQFILGVAWAWNDPVHRAIKFLLLFLAVWGMFFGALIVKRFVL
jgi:hypothetical protein